MIRHTLSAAILAAYISLSLIGARPIQATGTPAAPAQALDPQLMGMVIRDPWYDFGTYPGLPNEPNRVAQERMGQVLEETGVRWVRLEFFVEGDDDAALARTFARYDFFIKEVAPRHGLKVLGLLGFGVVKETLDPLNTADGINAKTFDDPDYGGAVNIYMQRWLKRSLAISAYYQEQVAAYEVLNEQNRLPQGGNAVPASLAARLHTKFYRLLKHPDPADGAPWRDSVQVIVGGLHPKGTLERGQKGYLSDADYLRQLYGYTTDPADPLKLIADPAQPFQEYRKTYGDYPLDGLGYHPYPEEIRLSLQAESALIDTRLTSIRSVLAEVQDPARRYWITEIGYNIAFKQQNAADQAAFLRAVYTGLSARGDVARIFWFKYEDFPPANGANAQRWGIVQIPFTTSAACPGGACYDVMGEPSARRPAFFVYRQLAGLPVYTTNLPIIALQ